MFLAFFSLSAVNKTFTPDNLEVIFFDEHPQIELGLDRLVLEQVG